MDAVRYALAQMRMVPQNRIEAVLILPDKRVNPLLELPVFTKCEKLGDPDDKKARDCDITSNSCTTSCYTIDAKAARSNTRFFSAHYEKDRSGITTIETITAKHLNCQDSLLANLDQNTTWKKTLFPFQVVAQLSEQRTGQFSARHSAWSHT